ncbi:MAG TPA: YicC/YloC family endoribonuclease [Kiloniellaceae bacterium]|nr:YicC/YloC family endoribonuclease [Kiloniellaceae bacterium]
MTASSGSVSSMTGFARREGGDDVMTWAWEVKSVNGRNLDFRSRLPSGFEDLEATIRGQLPKHCARGNFQINLTVQRGTAAARLQVNREALEDLRPVIAELRQAFDAPAPRVEGILALRGVLEEVEAPEDEGVLEARRTALASDLTAALEAIVAARRQEGAKLAAIVEKQLRTIESLTADAETCAASQPAALRAKLAQQLDELLQASPALPEDRLAQEAAILIGKADVREELDRLVAHCAAARALMAAGGAIGRKLDFLCQEFNREANTLCSKSADVSLTRIGLDMKAAIEQLREQIQNIE